MNHGRRKLRLGDLLVKYNVLTEADLQKGLELQKGSGKKLGEVLVENNICTDEAIADALSAQLNIEKVDLSGVKIDETILKMAPSSLCRKHNAIPYMFHPGNANVLMLAMSDPMDMVAIDDFTIVTNLQIEPVVTTPRQIAIAIDKAYVDAYVALSQTQDLMGNISEAVTTMLRVLDYSDDRSRIYRTIGSIYAREINYDTAMAYFRKAIEENPTDAEAYASMAVCCADTGDATTAMSNIEKALHVMEMNPSDVFPDGNPDVLCSAGMVYDIVGDFEKASEYFEQMLSTGYYTEPQCQLYTQFLFSHKVYEVMEQFAEESLDVYPHSPFYCTYLAAAYFYTNRYNRARKMLPDVSPAMLAEICPEIISHPLLGPLIPADPYNNSHNSH